MFACEYQKSLSRDGKVVKALVSPHCGPWLIPGGDAICALSLCWFSSLLQGIFSKYSGFPPSAVKKQNFQIPARLRNSGNESHLVDSTEIPKF